MTIIDMTLPILTYYAQAWSLTEAEQPKLICQQADQKH